MNWRLLGLALVLLAVFFGIRSILHNDHAVVSGATMVDVTIPSLNAAQTKGEAVFNANCASCHGKNAAGREGVAPPLIHKIYEPNHHGDMAFVLAAKQGVRQHHWSFGNMPPVPGVSDDEITNIIAYVRTLQRANGIQ